MNAEEDSHGDVENLRVDPAVEGVVPLLPKTGHHVEAVDKRAEEGQIREVELPVCIHEHDVIATGSAKARGQGSAIPPVDRMVNELDPRIGDGDGFDDCPGPVPAPIVYNDNLKII